VGLPIGPIGPQADDQKPFPFLHTEANETAAVLSPDGQWLAYISDESGRYEVYVQSFPRGGSKRQVSTGEAALELESSEREAFLDQACSGDATMRREVEALISADERARDYLESPAFDRVAETT
jgi:hypothetical protein